MMTGATGFIGDEVAHQLLDDGYDLRLLARTPSKANELNQRGATVVEGDLTDPGSIRKAMKGADGVFHIAAIYELGRDLEWMREVNVEGTRNILDVALEEDVDRILYCGSDTSLGDTGGEIGDETNKHPGDFRSNYARTKHEAHQLVEDYIDRGAPVVHAIVSSVYGPGDESPIAELIKNHLAGHTVAYLDKYAGYTFTHVEDVASGLKLAYEEGENGESYMISGEPATFEKFFKCLSEVSGVPEPRFEVPSWLVSLAKPLAEAGASLLGKTRNEINEMILMGRHVTRFFSSEKTQDQLNWKPRSLRDGLEDTVPWFGKQELEQSKDLLELAKYPLLGLAVFDIVLGTTATFMPELYTTILHGSSESASISGPMYLLPRTGTLWLVFAGVQGFAGLDPVNRKAWVMAAGVLRLMDVPADPVYYANSENLTLLGEIGLLSAPVFNFLTGSFFVYVGYRALKAQKWELTN